MAASHMSLIGCLLLVVVTLWKGATANSYTVGEELGWNIPPGGAVAYRTWAGDKTFQIGDTIEFKWSGPHTVAEVSSQADYDSCTKANPIGFYDSSPVRIILTSNATRYFICTDDNHCSDLGQKVTIKIGGDPSYTPVNDDDDDDHWWEWNRASSLSTIGVFFSAILSTIVIFFLSYI